MLSVPNSILFSIIPISISIFISISISIYAPHLPVHLTSTSAITPSSTPHLRQNSASRVRNILSGGKGLSLDLNLNANKIGHPLERAPRNHSNSPKEKEIEIEKRKRSFKLPFRRKRHTVDGSIIADIANLDLNDLDADADANAGTKAKLAVNIMPVVIDLEADEPLQANPAGHEQEPEVNDDAKAECARRLLMLFPDICPEFQEVTSQRMNYRFDDIIIYLLDQLEEGKQYPRRQSLKRKRASVGGGNAGASGSGKTNIADSPHGSANTIANLNHVEDDNDYNNAEERQEAFIQRAIDAFSTNERVNACNDKEYNKQACILLRQANLKAPQRHIEQFLRKRRYCLLPSVLAFDEILANLDFDNGDVLPYKEKVRGTLIVNEYTLPELPTAIPKEKSALMRDILTEYELALRLRDARRFSRQERLDLANREAANQAQAELEGAMRECECCCTDVPLNRTVHCTADKAHFFCKDCARRMAENQIGLGRYDLKCMSMKNCDESFSRDQRALFLSAKTASALDRIEQDYMLRVAGLEGLERCPFCQFAAEYPPIEDNKEFVCLNPTCETVSCRLCRHETHIPMNCHEAQTARGERPSARLLVEEAMSLAMIRSCNKCSTPFIKEHGCNKMTCTNAGCGNVQCYVCHKSCDYSHFDDTTRGGKQGNCPLFEDAETRHAQEVQAAEAKARDEVVRAHPGIDVSTLQFNLAGRALEDEQRRQGRVPGQGQNV